MTTQPNPSSMKDLIKRLDEILKPISDFNAEGNEGRQKARKKAIKDIIELFEQAELVKKGQSDV